MNIEKCILFEGNAANHSNFDIWISPKPIAIVHHSTVSSNNLIDVYFYYQAQ